MHNLSLVVIGRNDSTRLTTIYTDEYIRDLKAVFTELIYVDSLSDDNSVSLMKNHGFIVYQLNRHSYKSASAGRWVGTEEASADYILFLDSDMKLSGLEFMQSEISRTLKLGFCGFVGDVEDIYPNGTIRYRVRKTNSSTHEASSFGGFLLINKDTLKKAGNWNPYLPGNEELELFARLKANGSSILKTKKLKVKHYTIVTSALSELLGLYLPLRKERYGSFGFALCSAFKRKSLLSLLKLSPEPLYFLAALIISLTLVMTDKSVFIILVLGIYVALVTHKRSIKYCIIPPGIVLSFLVGIVKYNETQVGYDRK